jgi:hypothetical protein
MVRKSIFVAAFAACLLPTTSMALPAVQFYFTKTTDSVKINNLNLNASDTTFDLSVWYVISDTAFPNLSAVTFVGFDTSNSEGIGATPLDGKFGLNPDAAGAISNTNSHYPFVFGTESGGATLVGSDPNSVRPYGIEAFMGISGDAYDPGLTPVHLFDISFSNLGLTAGQSYNLVLWDAGQDTQSTTYLDGGADILRPGRSEVLTVTVGAVPEPASIIALGLGAAALLRRRRR